MSFTPPPPSPFDPIATPSISGSPLAPRKVTFGEAISLFYRNYANFSGRASRSEYWFVALYSLLAGFVFTFVGLSWILFLVNFIPGLALLVRRLHDTNRSGGYAFFLLLPLIGAIVILVLLCTSSDESDNRFGPAS